ncbi:MAG: hypothetical protein HGA87_02795 [Desulfobulbaceae bacterium]|nr:hypothetical protein [Desulfobulbaceae bacterium]
MFDWISAHSNLWGAFLKLIPVGLVFAGLKWYYDQSVIAEKKATEIRSMLYTLKLKVEDFLASTKQWEDVCKDCVEYNPDTTFRRYEKTGQRISQTIDSLIGKLDFPVVSFLAPIILLFLESQTAFIKHQIDQVDRLVQQCRSNLNCNNKQVKSL